MCWEAIDMLAFEIVARLFCCGAGVRDLTLRVEPGGIVALIGLTAQARRRWRDSHWGYSAHGTAPCWRWATHWMECLRAGGRRSAR